MVNTINGHSFDEKQGLTLSDLQENGEEKITGLSDDELKGLKQQALEAEDYDICKLIKQEQIKRAERERQTGENIKEEGDLQMLEEKAKIEEEKIQSRAKQEEEANAMKSLLDEPDDVLAKKFPWMEMGNGNNATYENDSNEGLKRRPRLNPERKDPYSRETLSRYSDGDVIDLYYIEGKKPISEQWLKEEGGYRKVENGKATEEFVTEQEMVIKMRDVRSSYKSETQLISSNTQSNSTETHENKNTDRIIKPRPRLNPERKDPYFGETLSRYVDGDIIELYYREGKGPISEGWKKENGGYVKMDKLDGKYIETGEKITEEEMVIKMREARSSAKVGMIGKTIENSADNTPIGNASSIEKNGQQPESEQLDQVTQNYQSNKIEIQNNNEYTEYVKIIEHENVIDYSKWNMSEDVKEYLDNPNTCKPFFEANIDGQQMFLTAPQRLFGLGGYVGPIGFVKVNGKYEIRYFIKSGSEGLWRCCPGYCGRNISKLNEFNIDAVKPETEKRLRKNGFNYTGNFSYERTTMVDFRLGEMLEDLYVGFYVEGGKYFNRRAKFWPKNQSEPKIKADSKDENLRKNFINMSKEIDVTDDFSDLFRTDKDKQNIELIFQESTVDEVKDIYKKETLGIDINSFTKEKEKRYQYFHLGFDCYVDVEVYTAKMGGKDIEIFFSHTENEPDLVWIDNIQYKNQRINSYGVASKQINAGWLTKKPMDYTEQCPKGYQGTEYSKKYTDIRPLYQDNPLITKYKELSHRFN